MTEKYNIKIVKRVFLFFLSFVVGVIIMLAYGFTKLPQKNLQTKSVLSVTTKFSFQNAPMNTLIGNISSMSGTVEWESRTATQPAILNAPRQIQQGEEIITQDSGRAVVRFVDVFSAAISSKTDLNFIQTLPADIVINQTRGTAEYTKTGNIPLSIRSFDLLININNGDTTITSDTKKRVITVSINSGSITVAYNDLQNISKVITVTEGKQFVFNNNARQAVIK